MMGWINEIWEPLIVLFPKLKGRVLLNGFGSRGVP